MVYMIRAGSLINQPDTLHGYLKYYVISVEYVLVCHPGARFAEAFFRLKSRNKVMFEHKSLMLRNNA